MGLAGQTVVYLCVPPASADMAQEMAVHRILATCSPLDGVWRVSTDATQARTHP